MNKILKKSSINEELQEAILNKNQRNPENPIIL